MHVPGPRDSPQGRATPLSTMEKKLQDSGSMCRHKAGRTGAKRTSMRPPHVVSGKIEKASNMRCDAGKGVVRARGLAAETENT